MGEYEKESELIAYCGIYCRLCDYFTGRIRDSAKELLEIVKTHGELKLFAEIAKTFEFENFVKGLEWLSNKMSPCIGGCKGGGGWKECPIRKCCIDKDVRFCNECKQFPCEIIEKFPNRIETLKDITQFGLEDWIKKQLRKT
ncbi:MAG: DUF3795 domain-containing protein [Candidatus Korarchaeota archaeon]|nr:DUF3795 domain-containing protein [Candidatus Korarchaeota archaeon]NIU85381.1 DUF3795 domain-containing protein [Candidatus Thorarchaeota archaeon]NIW15479.1 DUF3795 domain-containing protein [Candidatus Thorarchaeota archaeon]NIW53423.1 DUF3795 domain-containing protein [Candidatus Korarchaeota archaeon]